MIQVEHSFGLGAFEEDYPAVAGKSRDEVVYTLVEAIEKLHPVLGEGGAALIKTPLSGILIRESVTGPGDLFFVRSFELDSSVDTFFQEALDRKAKSIAKLGVSRRILLVEDHVHRSASLGSLTHDIVLPSAVGQVILWCRFGNELVELGSGG